MGTTEFVKIKSIRESSPKDIYHLTVKNNHNFFGNKLCMHNCGYTGDFSVKVYNLSDDDVFIKKGERYAQVKVIKKPNYVIQELNDEQFEELKAKQQRGNSGFGSSGK